MTKQLKNFIIALIVLGFIGIINNIQFCWVWMYTPTPKPDYIQYPYRFLLSLNRLYVPSTFFAKMFDSSEYQIPMESWLTVLCNALLVIYGFLFITNNGKIGIRYIKFSLSIIALNLFLFLPLSIYRQYLLFNNPNDNFLVKNDFEKYYNLITFIVIFAINLLLLLYTKKALQAYEQQSKIQDLDDTIFKTENLELSYNNCSTGKRFFHYVIDLALILCFCFSFIRYFLELQMQNYSSSFYGDREDNQYLVRISIALTLVFYYFIAEGLLGYSPAKALLGSKVIRADGSAIGFGKAFLRSISRLVPFEAFSTFGVAPWHDKWTDTYVVDTKLINSLGEEGDL